MKPATPLPWTASKNETRWVQSREEGRVVATVETRDLDYVEDARYLAHAANAYPKLVELLKDLTGKIEVMGGCNAHDFEGDEAWPEFERVTKLLSELGES